MGINTTPDKPINVSVGLLYEVEELPLEEKGGHIINTAPEKKQNRFKKTKGSIRL